MYLCIVIKGACLAPSLNSTDYRETIINYINEKIYDRDFKGRSKDDPKSYIRRRKISFTDTLVFIMKGLTRSLQRELNIFYKETERSDFLIQKVTKSAFSQSRQKLKPEAFIELSDDCLEMFYNKAPYYKWKNHRLLSCDGSTVLLPNHTSIKSEFGETGYGPKKDSKKSLARISLLYDVLNYTTIDAQLSPLSNGERFLLGKHSSKIKCDDICILDRGYPSFRLIYDFIKSDKLFLMRMKLDWWKQIKEFSESQEIDTEVEFTLRAKDRNELALSLEESKMKCRLIAITLPTGEKEILCTNLLDKDKYNQDDFDGLYHLRWNVEEGYKLLKSRAHLDEFSGKTANSVKQDFNAQIFAMNLCATLAFPVDEVIRNETKHRKFQYKSNRTNGLGTIKESVVSLFIRTCSIKDFLKYFDDILRKTPELIRPGRSCPRNKIQKQPASQNYKRL